MIHDRVNGTLTFEVNDAPPVTIRNVSATARPFANMVFVNDSMTLLTPEENLRHRRRWQNKRRLNPKP